MILTFGEVFLVRRMLYSAIKSPINIISVVIFLIRGNAK
jgi:hypothetical protein